jgi:hypothetical protein
MDMRRWLYWPSQLIIVAVIMISYGYSVTLDYSDLIHVNPRGNFDKIQKVDLNTMANVKLLGSFEVTNGTTRDIDFYILDKYDFINWKNGYNFTSVYRSARVSADGFDLSIVSSGEYHIVFDNSFTEAPKDVDVEVKLIYAPIFLALPLRIWIFIAGVGLSAFLAYVQYTREQKKPTPAENNLMALALAMIGIIGVASLLSPNVTEMISSLLTVVNVILVVWNLRLTQRNMRIQLTHEDRKRSLAKLYSILENSSNYDELIKGVKPFTETLEFELLPNSVKQEVSARINELEVSESEAPWHIQYSPEELDQMMQQQDEAQAEERETLDVGERYESDLNSQASTAKSQIKRQIKAYFEEPSEE